MSLKASGEKKLLKLGPLGSETRGSSFDHGAHSSIRQVVISYTPTYIRSIKIKYDDYGSSVWSEKLGSFDVDSDTKVHTIKLDYPNEYLVSVRGRLDSSWWFPTFVSSITFRSNKNTYGPYGDESSGGTHFSFHESDNMIVGFHGRVTHSWDKGIGAIGAYLKPIDCHSQNRNFIPCDEDNKQVITVAGNHVMENKGKDIGAIGAYPKSIDRHSQNRNFIPCDEYNKQVITVAGNHVMGNKDKDIGAIGAYPKPIDRHSQNRNFIPCDEYNKQVITVAGNHVMGNKGKDIGAIGAYPKPIDRHSQNRNFIPCDEDNKQVITVVGNHVMRNKGKDIGAIGAYPKPIDRHSQNRNFIPCDEDNKQVITVAGNHVMGNEGKDIGTFVVGNRIIYNITQYYSEKPSIVQ